MAFQAMHTAWKAVSRKSSHARRMTADAEKRSAKVTGSLDHSIASNTASQS